MIIEKLDGPKGDPILDEAGNIVGTYQGIVVEGEPTNGDWARFTDGADVSEHRFFIPPPPSTAEQLQSRLDALNAQAAAVASQIASISGELQHQSV